jgi:tetratricopeptide (TPR) repeat protein
MNLEHAIADYNKAIYLDSGMASAYNGRGGAYASSENYEQAIVDFNRAIELDQGDALAFYNRGMAYLNSKDIEQAIVDFEWSLKLSPNAVNRSEVKKLIEQLKSEISRR